MSLLNAIIMGIVQGIAEFLPISSSGHLVILRQLLHMETDNGLLFEVLLHLGTLAAVFIVFWGDIKELIIEGIKLIGDFFINVGHLIKNIFVKEKVGYRKLASTPYRRFVLLVIVSTVPTGIIGVLFKDLFEKAGTTLLVPGICLIVTGVLLLVSDRLNTGKKTEQSATYKDAGLVGLAQGIAILPGLSRSGATISAGLMTGFDKSFAVKYSFIMSIPAILGANLIELKDFSADMVSSSQVSGYILGTIVAGVVGYISIKTMLKIVRGKKFKYFAYYCFLMGIISIVGFFVV